MKVVAQFGLMLLGFVLALSAKAELNLVVDTPAGVVRIMRATSSRLSGRLGEDSISLPFDSPIRVEGELLANARFLQWPTNYRIVRPPARESDPAPPRPWFGYIRLVGGSNWSEPLYPQVWPENVPNPTGVVFGWVVNGKIVRTHFALLPSDRRFFRVDHAFLLTAAESVGHAVLMLWANGSFITPRPTFRAEAMQSAATNLRLDNRMAFEAAVTRGSELRVSDRDATTLLNLAAGAGMNDAVDMLLQAGARTDSETLGWAAARGRTAVVKRLLAAKTDPNRRGSITTLQSTLFAGHDETAQALLEGGADPSLSHRDLRTPLELAVDAGHVTLARQMLARGARPFRVEPLQIADQIQLGHTASAQLLLDWKCDPNAVVGRRSLLWLAARCGNSALVRALLRSGARPDPATPDEVTPLMMACVNCDAKAVDALLKAGAKISARSANGGMAIHFATLQSADDVLSVLVAHGADLNAASAGYLRPLEIALLAGQAKTARFLAAHGAQCGWSGEKSASFLEAAVTLDIPDIVRAALAEGSDEERQRRRRHASDLATLLGAGECEQFLRATNKWDGDLTPAPLVVTQQLDALPVAIRTPQPLVSSEPGDRLRDETVEVEFLVDETGGVVGPRLLGVVNGRLGLAALEAIRQWQFSPPRYQGGQARVKFKRTFAFVRSSAATLDPAFVDTPAQPLTRSIPDVSQLGYPFKIVESSLRVRCIIDAEGRVENMRAVDADGESVAWELKQALFDWAFAPATKNGIPVRSWTEVLTPVD